MSVDSLPAQGPAADPLRLIGEGLHRIINHAQRLRSRANATTQGQFEWSAGRLVATLVRHGPMRMTALATAVDSDLSNVSRHVSSLVDGDLIERQSDPADGRACLLAATDLGRSRHQDQTRYREARLDVVLAQWSDADRAEFARLLNRFSLDFEQQDLQPPVLSLVNPQNFTNSANEQDEK